MPLGAGQTRNLPFLHNQALFYAYLIFFSVSFFIQWHISFKGYMFIFTQKIQINSGSKIMRKNAVKQASLSMWTDLGGEWEKQNKQTKREWKTIKVLHK